MRRLLDLKVTSSIVAVALLWTGPLQANPVQFSFSATVGNITGVVPGVGVGTPISITVFGDNGGSSLESQTWNNADITSATLTAGSYTASYVPPSGFGDPMFVTDASGIVTASREGFAANLPNTDSLSGEVAIEQSRNAFHASNGGIAFWSFPAQDTWDESNWTVSESSALETLPTSMTTTLLTALGLLGMGVFRCQGEARDRSGSVVR